MSDRDDRSYLEFRARKERSMAALSRDSAVALAHLRLAEAYDQRLRETGTAAVAQTVLASSAA